jgi:hypothetical protein
MEVPELQLDWKPVGLPTTDRPLLDGMDVGLFVGPPRDTGVDRLVLETTGLVAVMGVGHPLGGETELTVADVLGERFPGSPRLDPDWTAFWTLDEQRGGPAERSDDDVTSVAEVLEVVAARRAIVTLPATLALGLPHTGVIALPLVDGPRVSTSLFWRAGDDRPVMRRLAGLAADMTRDRAAAPRP